MARYGPLSLESNSSRSTRQTQIRFGCLASEHLIGRERIDASLEQLRAAPKLEQLMPKFITNAIAGKSLPVYGNGLNVREWIYVADTVPRSIPFVGKTISVRSTPSRVTPKRRISKSPRRFTMPSVLMAVHTLCDNRSHSVPK
ncbi:NAD-dependent epimerase/dehydratase family protein [Halorubrum salipaludis]|uniref:NAD-dependent epimerase/dehydratase family protein n=1 Tax=Halorubrum salipaludis TaxID=2032630 RepID=UPI001181AF90